MAKRKRIPMVWEVMPAPTKPRKLANRYKRHARSDVMCTRVEPGQALARYLKGV